MRFYYSYLGENLRKFEEKEEEKKEEKSNLFFFKSKIKIVEININIRQGNSLNKRNFRKRNKRIRKSG